MKVSIGSHFTFHFWQVSIMLYYSGQMLVLSVWLVKIHAVVLAINTTICYGPNGIVDESTSPCNLSASQLGIASPCCSLHDICFDGSVCYQGWSGVMYRASCTDPTFQATECPNMCLTGVYIVAVFSENTLSKSHN